MSTPPKPARQTLPRSFQAAFAGLAHGIRTQRNMQIHLGLAAAAGVAAVLLGLSRIESGLVIVCIGLMWSVELLNTAVEVVVDDLSPEYHAHARIAKDVAAAAVLMAALSSATVGVLLFVPRIWDML
jgi:undecaprenol kinase/diacylglycerol kinase (ATP)